MSFDPFTALLDIGGKVIDRVLPDPAAKQAAQIELLKLAQTGELARLTAETDLARGQIAVNQAEAANGATFVSGWRPFVGWVCGSGLGLQFLIAPLLSWGAAMAGHPVAVPSLDMSTLLTLLAGMLGLGGLRTVEKLSGVAAK
ncbi:Holin of 3TMs, for gene-transfer release [Sphingomonas sp. YR710]|uniref:holin family protein n=1 Tax=Sphingomonas sp. YR710 TaxID=1882773 RepID=UPI000889040F|nr:holin family protein [Sphingomonas sp. YR710]SDC49529.1 Holin of 3TMs, for gene-transfer release [Sphingomonas sp. YR710]